MGMTATFIRLSDGELRELIHNQSESDFIDNHSINIDKT